MPERIPQAATIRVPLQAYLSSDHISPATGKTIAVTISKNGAAYGNPSGGATNATEIGNGSYYVDLSTTDTGTAGPLFVLGSVATIDNIVAIYDVVNANTGGLAALPNVASGGDGGLAVTGATQTMNLKQLNIVNSAGDAIVASATGSNGNGINASGNGTADGIKATGGATGRGIHALGGATSGAGIRCEGQGGNSMGFHGLGFGSGAGMRFEGGTTGQGASFIGGATSGDGIDITTTQGDGLSITPTSGSAIVATGNGTSKAGIIATGGTAGTSDGVKMVAGTGGVDLRANMTGNVTGNLSGSVGSVTGAVGSVTGAVGSVTGNVGGNVTGSVGSVTADVGITQAAADKVWNTTVRTLSSFGTLVADVATAVWGAAVRVLTAGTNIVLAKGTGITGFNDIAATAIVSGGAITTSGGKVSEVALVDTLTTYTGNTPQTGDAFARIGAAGAGLTSVALAASEHTAIAGDVLNATASSYNTALTIGQKINAAGSAGDPWSTSLPGSYVAGQAGYIVGNNLNAAVNSVAAAVWAVGARALTDKVGFALTSDYDPAKTAAQAGNAMALTSGERTAVADALLNRTDGIETGVTPKMALQDIAAATAGLGSGFPTTTVQYSNVGPQDKKRITATVDADGNRTAVTYDNT